MLSKEFREKFFEDTDHTGRHMIVSFRTGKQYCVEAIDSGNRQKWGDLNPATGKVEGKYGSKYRGCIDKKDSLIEEENGFKNIKTFGPGQSPYGYIDELDAQYPDKEC